MAKKEKKENPTELMPTYVVVDESTGLLNSYDSLEAAEKCAQGVFKNDLDTNEVAVYKMYSAWRRADERKKIL